jgi:ABC-2 type transport system ATP-binding protein
LDPVGEPIVVAQGLGFAYGDIVALAGATLAVPPGRVGLVGANGAGKTTLLKLLLGILRPDAGDVRVLGHPVPAETLQVRSRVGYMPETACLPPDQTAADFVGYCAELAGLPARAARQRASDVLTLVGLHEERFRRMRGFSTGMLQRAKLAQAIVHDPDLVLLDEPTAGLDPEGRDEMLDLITRLDSFGINALVSSHVLTDIERTCDWVVMLDGGRVLRSGPLTELAATDEITVEVLDDPAPVVAALGRRGAEVVMEGTTIVVRRPGGDPADTARDALAETGAALRRLGVRRTTLEDIFLHREEA